MKLTLKPPTVPFIITQRFGENGEYYRRNGINVAGHNGLDLQTGHGQPVYASHDGTAYYTDNDGMEGDGVVVVSNEKYEIDGTESLVKTIFWHLCDPHKEPQFASPVFGKTSLAVKAGDIIGYADNTGFSSGDHLHYGLKPVAAGEKPGAWWNIRQNNGYGGAIDPFPYIVQDIILFTRELSVGAVGEDVRRLQFLLGMPEKYQTGYFGLITKGYVIAYQIKNGITPYSGYVGIKTLAKLNSAV